MKRKISCGIVLLLTLCMLSGCALAEGLVSILIPDMTEFKDLPHLMVTQIDVSMHPQDPDHQRTYQTQENLTAVLEMLRDMVTMDHPDTEPDRDDGQTYYTITATYANGKQQEYCLLGYRYLKVGDEPWCEISFDRAMDFTQYLQEHYSDDGSYIPPATEPPAETTVPAETGESVPPTT